MKANDAILVTTFVRFRRENWRPDRDVILALTADEESGSSNGVAWLLEHHRDLVDAEFVLNADSGGVTTLKGKTVNVDIEASEKMYADFELTATNPGGHSSLPTPDNAIYHVADALARLEKAPFPVELNEITRTYFERRATLENAQTRADMNAILQKPPDPAAVARLSRDPRYNSMMRTTCVATRLSAGHANNALPQLAQASLLCRARHPVPYRCRDRPAKTHTARLRRSGRRRLGRMPHLSEEPMLRRVEACGHARACVDLRVDVLDVTAGSFAGDRELLGDLLV